MLFGCVPVAVTEQGVSDGESSPDVRCGVQAEVADLVVAARKNVLEKALDEDQGWETDAVVSVSAKADGVVLDINEAEVRDRDAVRVSSQVLQDVGRATERLFDVDTPLLCPGQ